MAFTLGRRSFLRLQGGVATLAALALAGCLGQEDPQPVVRPNTVTPADAADVTPEDYESDLPVLLPGEVIARLLSGESAFPGLPAGHAIESYGTEESSQLLPEARAVLTYTLTGLDYQNSVTFAVHDDPVAARNGWGGLSVTRGYRTDAVDGLPYPARVVNYKTEGIDVGYTVISVLAGQTVIEAMSALAVETPAGNFTHALELAVSAIAHLEQSLSR